MKQYIIMAMISGICLSWACGRVLVAPGVVFFVAAIYFAVNEGNVTR